MRGTTINPPVQGVLAVLAVATALLRLVTVAGRRAAWLRLAAATAAVRVWANAWFAQRPELDAPVPVSGDA
jgi:hypothetical protein